MTIFRSQHLLHASKLPILDAAVLLWLDKSKINSDLGIIRQNGHDDFDDDDMDALNCVLFELQVENYLEHKSAKDGVLVDWLKLTHPKSTDTEISMAIEAAVKLDLDSTKYCFEKSSEFGNDIVEIMKRVFELNSGFGKETKRRMSVKMSYAMSK